MHISVDFTLCESNALCMAAAPQVFEVRDDDVLYILNADPDDDLGEEVTAAMRACPKQAIRIED